MSTSGSFPTRPSSTPPSMRSGSFPTQSGGRRRRGLLDAVLTAVLVYAVYATTPIGAVAETAINIARGQKQHPSWLATFKGRETSVERSDASPLDQTAASASVPPPIAAAATKYSVDEEALAALISVHGACTPTTCDAETPPRLSTLFPPVAGKARVDVDELAQALKAGSAQLQKNPALAIEAMYVGAIPVKLAMEQADRSGSPVADDVEAHAPFFSPSTRRGPLQGALAVLAVYRLRTLAWPADGKWRITSPFGERIHPVTGVKSFHNGTDIGVPVGTELLAGHNGSVKRRSQDSISGNYVILNLGLGIETVYCHLSDPRVEEGARVKRKDLVGLSGATGRVTGPHLHYILRIEGNAVDAEKYGASPSRTQGLSAPVEVKPVDPPPVDPPKGKKPAPAKPKPAAKPASMKAAPTDAGPAPVDTKPVVTPADPPPAPPPPTTTPTPTTPPVSPQPP